MPGKVALVVTAGPIQGRRYEFSEHDTFLFGRAPDCHAELPAGDTSASRHHFLLEVNPPAARLRDLGSLNGTHVNGVRHGGRERGESPEAAAGREFAQVDLKDGDQIRVGATVFSVAIEPPTAPVAVSPAVLAASAGHALRPGLTAADGLGSMGGYELGAVIGRGGMGAVYLARRASDGATVALKVLLPQVLVNPALRDTFLREIEVTRSLRHPRIVELLDYGYDRDGFFFAMEYCPGGSALGLMRAHGGRLDAATATRLALEAAEGLAFAHEWGFVHRDIKPDNILIAADGSARVTDFGLAKSFQQAGLSGMTATGAAAGTLYFMPREQLTSFRQLRPVSDVWSLGATLYHLLTGLFARDFVPGKDPVAVVLRGGVVPIRQRDPAVPEALARVVDRAIADDPQQRYANGAELRDALRAVAPA